MFFLFFIILYYSLLFFIILYYSYYWWRQYHRFCHFYPEGYIAPKGYYHREVVIAVAGVAGIGASVDVA